MDPGREPIPAEFRSLLETLLRYVVDHPEAKDSLEGIHQWWLPQGGLEWDIGRLEKAIDFLLERGWMEQGRVGTRRIFGVCSERQHEIAAALAQLEIPAGRGEVM